jgi:1-acyl-sn-glycerol-3-phosphate acyltransferase
MFSSWPKVLFFAFIVRPIVWICLGLHVVNRERLLRHGPRIIVANHNSHLDTLVLMSLFPLRLLPRVRPVAAADYFLTTRGLSWVARTLIGIIPISRTGETAKEHLFDSSTAALHRDDILILFPEGTRGEPGKMAPFRKGIYHLAKSHPECAVVPVFPQGLGKALPKGETVLVPFNCTVVVGEEMLPADNADAFVARLEATLSTLAAQG